MGISKYIANRKTKSQIKQKENIVLQKPIVILFAGDFCDEEDYVVKLLSDRIGGSNKISFGRFAFASLDTTQSTTNYSDVLKIKNLSINDIDAEKEYSIKERNRIIKEIGESKSLKEDIGDYVNEIFNETLMTPYPHRAQIYLSCIIQLESMKAAGFAAIITELKRKFLEYFTNGVTIDFYCMLDQIAYKNEELEDERKAFSYLALNEINNLVKNDIISMPYILSNYVSTYHLDLNSRKESLTATALTILVKNGKSVKESSQNELYNDDSFKQECKVSGGSFYSLGYLNLQVADEAASYIVYKTVLEHIYQDTKRIDRKSILTLMELDEEQVDSICNPLIKISSFPDHIFYSMVKNKNVYVTSMINNSRSNIIEAVYGRNLEQFMAINSTFSDDKALSENNMNSYFAEMPYMQKHICFSFQQNKNGSYFRTDPKVVLIKKLVDEKVKKVNKELRDMYVEKKYSIAEIYNIIQHIEGVISSLCLKYEQKSYDYYQGYENWKNENCGISDFKIVKDTNEPRAFYIIGRQYLEWLLKIEDLKNTKEFLKQFYEQIKLSSEYYNKQSYNIGDAIKELNDDIEVLTLDGISLCTENMYNYYTDIANQILTKDMLFDDFERKLNNDICMKEVQEEGIYERVVKYCDEHILTSPHFEKDFSKEMVKRLINFSDYISVDKIYDFAFETIMLNRKYYASHTEFGELHQEVCFLVNPNNQFVNSTNVRMQKLKTSRQLKLFYEKYFDGMDVLFMEGCFDIEKLFNYTVYEKKYQKLLDKE